MPSFLRECRFALRERTFAVALIVAFAISAVAITVGIVDVRKQNDQIELLQQISEADLQGALKKVSDPGSMAYYTFHFTHAPPSALAFAANGNRDALPWKHRIRMLALEGQIYESDIGNPELNLHGSLDYAFVASVLLPLLLILLLHDLMAGERRERRFEWLVASAREGENLIRMRALARGAMLLLAILLPFVFAAPFSGAAFIDVLQIIAAVSFSALFWWLVCIWTISRVRTGAACAVVLLGLWLTFTLFVPVSAKLIAERRIDAPSGGEILLAQREAVNDAWDLTVEETMTPFFNAHPQWRGATPITMSFDWWWYFAFQQVGDQIVSAQSQALRDAVSERDALMGLAAYLSPPLIVERWMTRAARTDMASYQAYEQCVRDFHAGLREYYYSVMFSARPYDQAFIDALPRFEPCHRSNG
ncbi:MAG: DUF3526 domain-containing protein [Pseudomonadota bacterium]